MAIVFDNSDGASDAPYHRWCKVHANGFVINTRRPFNANLAMLHRAVCRTIHYAIVAIQPNSFTGQAYMKVCSDDIGDLLNWIQKNGGKNFSSYCGTCHPLSHPGPI